MKDNRDRLREAFEAHESLAPDPAEVYAEVQRLARSYRRRRWGTKAAGGAVLGAGLIAGVISLPGMLPTSSQNSVATVAPGAAVPAVSPSQWSPAEAQQIQDRRAFFEAGYDYDDAVELAKIWHRTGGDLGLIKAEAGRRLLAGETLPVAPTPDAPVDTVEAARVDAFFKAGYDYDDAVKLAGLWKQSDPYQAKVEGGRKLLAGETLPFRP